MMKKIFILLILILPLSGCVPAPLEVSGSVAPAPEQSLATPLAPSFDTISNPILTHIDMLNPLNGWAQAEGMILRTEDGGESWLNVTPPDILSDPAYAKSFFLDETTGWFLLEDVDKPNAGEIYRTLDGGGTWLWRAIPFGRAEFGFLDSEKGYALFSMGAAAGSMGVSVWTTVNGGGDYNRVFFHEPGFEYTLPFSGIKNGISFRDPLNGWVGGTIPMDGVIWLYRSVDGGLSWAEQKVDLPTDYENYQTSTYAPLFFDDGLATLPVQLRGEKPGYVFYLSSDGGETWGATLPVNLSGTYAIASHNEIIVWDGSDTLYSTDDGGETWSFHASDWQPLDLLREIDFVSVNEGWALTEYDLYRTKDGGKTWEKLEN